MHFHRLSALVVVVLLAATASLHAQAADSAPPPLKGTLDLGLVAASGNTDITTLSIGEKLEYAKGKWTVTQGFKMVNSQSKGEETANEYGAYVQPAYILSKSFKAYVLGSWDRNPFLGISQRFQEGVGVSFGAVQGPKHFVTLDAGFSYFQQTFTTDVETTFPTARGQLTYKYAFTSKAYFQDIFVFLPNLQAADDYRVNNEASLVAPLVGHLAFKASYLLQYQNAPLAGFGTTDNLYTTGLQVTF